MELERYERNRPMISPEEQDLLAQKRVLVVGCGGLGGYLIEQMCRTGIGHITAVDGDTFSPSNLNRQLLATEDTLGRPKAVCAAERMAKVNPLCEVRALCQMIEPENADEIVAGHDLVVDALDNRTARLLLLAAARRAGIPMVCGAVAGWHGRVVAVRPTDNLDMLWAGAESTAAFGNLCPPVLSVAALEFCESLKILLDRPNVRYSQLIEMDLRDLRWDIIPMQG